MGTRADRHDRLKTDSHTDPGVRKEKQDRWHRPTLKFDSSGILEQLKVDISQIFWTLNWNGMKSGNVCEQKAKKVS